MRHRLDPQVSPGRRVRSAEYRCARSREAGGGLEQSGVLLPRQHGNLLQRGDHEVDETHIPSPEKLHHQLIRQLAQDLLVDGVEVYTIALGPVVEPDLDLYRLEGVRDPEKGG